MKVTFKSGQVATYALQDTNGGVLERLEGFVGGSSVANTQYFVQLFDLSALPTGSSIPAGAAVPKRSLQVLGQDGFRFDFTTEDLEFKNGITIVLSSTEVNYTAVGGGITCDFEGEIDTQTIQGTTTVGDLTTGVNGLTVWTSAAGPNYLFEIDWISNAGAVSYLLLFTKTSPQNTVDVPDAVLADVDSSDLNAHGKALRFGKSGLSLISQSLTKGCVLRVSSTPLVLNVIAASENLRAKYKTAL